MSIKSNSLLKLIYILAWIGFLGLCVQAGALLTSFSISLWVNEAAAKNLYMGLNLSALKAYDSGFYVMMVLCVVVILILQALLFYTVIQIFQKISYTNPFHVSIKRLIERLALLSLFVGWMSKMADGYAQRFVAKGIAMPELSATISQGGAFLFFAGILYFISLVFSKGIELQTENDLTV